MRRQLKAARLFKNNQRAGFLSERMKSHALRTNFLASRVLRSDKIMCGPTHTGSIVVPNNATNRLSIIRRNFIVQLRPLPIVARRIALTMFGPTRFHITNIITNIAVMRISAPPTPPGGERFVNRQTLPPSFPVAFLLTTPYAWACLNLRIRCKGFVSKLVRQFLACQVGNSPAAWSVYNCGQRGYCDQGNGNISCLGRLSAFFVTTSTFFRVGGRSGFCAIATAIGSVLCDDANPILNEAIAVFVSAILFCHYVSPPLWVLLNH